jgi:metallophosphoesterase (TIGR00282 family)
LKIAFIGDIVGRPGRDIIKKNLTKIRDDNQIDFVIANYENASHGFGLTTKNANELFNSGIDLMTGGNHSWDKKDIFEILQTHNIIRPHNYPDSVDGTGVFKTKINDQKLAVINLMGFFSMPQCTNPFICANKTVDKLIEDGYKNIFIDFHAEATAEKRTMFLMLKDRITALCGTHTHIGTDDLMIHDNSMYLTDIGLTGCYDNVIGMELKSALKRALTGLPAKLDIDNKCKKILQLIVMEFDNGKCLDAYKIKLLDNNTPFVSNKAHFFSSI